MSSDILTAGRHWTRIPGSVGIVGVARRATKTALGMIHR